jgi:hypothetical protein
MMRATKGAEKRDRGGVKGLNARDGAREGDGGDR